jgi:hypothetical protein
LLGFFSNYYNEEEKVISLIFLRGILGGDWSPPSANRSVFNRLTSSSVFLERYFMAFLLTAKVFKDDY